MLESWPGQEVGGPCTSQKLSPSQELRSFLSLCNGVYYILIEKQIYLPKHISSIKPDISNTYG